MIDHAPNTTAMVGKELPTPHWGRWFRSISDWLQSTEPWMNQINAWIHGTETPTAWAPTISAETGTASKQGVFVRVGSVVYLTVTITPSDAWSVAAGASVALPVQSVASGGMAIHQAGTILGAGQVNGANLVLPAISTSAPLTISGAYLGG